MAEMTVGFIGLGTMGAPMAWNVYRKGYPLGVYNRDRRKTEPFRAEGCRVYETPAEAAAASDVVVIMVTGPEALLEIVSGKHGVMEGIQRGRVVINMSTVSEDATQETAHAVTSAGGLFLDAAVSGSRKPAEEGSLVVLAGGDPALIDRMEPLLLTMGKKVIRCGGVGKGTQMKLMINLLLADMMAAFSEALVFGDRCGLSMEAMLDTVASGAMAAPMFALKGKAVAQGDFSKHFPVNLVFKDLNLVLEAAGRTGVPLPLTAAARELFSAARAQGWGDEDMAAVVKVLRRLAVMD